MDIPSDCLMVNDPRVDYRLLEINDTVKYTYRIIAPKDRFKATVILLHGWPDLGIGWRYQVPHIVRAGYQVVVPDMLGYGRSSAPNELTHYSLREMSNHMAKLIEEVSETPVILGGHDWGAFLAWRVALYHSHMIRAIFSFCVPFFSPGAHQNRLDDMMSTDPLCQYQVQNKSGQAEAIAMKSPKHTLGYFRAIFGGTTPSGLPGFSPEIGVVEERMLQVGSSPLVNEELLNFYVRETRRSGLRGPMNWYRTTENNRDDEMMHFGDDGDVSITMPAMIVMAGQDPVLKPSLVDGTESLFRQGLRKEIIASASHWVHIHYPQECNALIESFLSDICAKDISQP